MQDIMRYDSPAGNTLWEINVGALCGYPAPIVRVTVEKDGLRVKTEHLEPRLDLLKEHVTAMITRVLDSAAAGDKREFARRVTALQADGDKIARYFFAVRPAARWLNRLSVQRAAKLIRFLSLGKAVNRGEIKEFPDCLVMDVAKEVFLSVFDGGLATHERGGGYYRAVMSAISLIKNKQLMDAVDAILTGGEIDSNDAFLA